MNFIKGLAHLLLIWLAIMVTLASAAFLIATFDMMGDLGPAIQIHHSGGNT